MLMTKKEITYRSKSLHGLFYASDHEIQKAKEIHELSPAGFEEHSEKYVTKRFASINEHASSMC